jgi:hypothetical protein
MVTTAAIIGVVGSVVAAGISASGQASAAATTKEAAELQTQVARELHDHWKAYYKQCDIDNINELCHAPVYDARYPLIEGRVRLEALRTSAAARDKARRTQDIYNVGATCQTIQYLAGVEAMMLTDNANYAYRWERTNVQQREQLRIANRFKGLSLGRNLLAQSMAASALAAQISGRVAALQGQAAQNWATLASYLTSERGQKQISDAWEIFKKDFGIGQGTPTVPNLDFQTTVPTQQAPQEGVGAADPGQTGDGGATSDSTPADAQTTFTQADTNYNYGPT